MRSKLARPDLQILINEICRSLIENKFHLWIEHIPGKENVIPDALSRYFHRPFKTAQRVFDKRVNGIEPLQRASDLCRNIQVNKKSLVFEDDDV